MGAPRMRTINEAMELLYQQDPKHIFSEKKDKLCNFAAYSDGKCSQEEFCKFLKAKIAEPQSADENMQRIYGEIKDGI